KKRSLGWDETDDASEEEGAERAKEKARRIGGKRGQERRRIIAGRKEQRGEKRCQRGIEIEVVPFENSPRGRRDDDEFFVARHSGGSRGRMGQSACRHENRPSLMSICPRPCMGRMRRCSCNGGRQKGNRGSFISNGADL